MATTSLFEPPKYCEYVPGACDQRLPTKKEHRALFLFASKPEVIASTIDDAIDHLRDRAPSDSWRSWRDLPIAGQVIFCEICKACRASTSICADVTTLNFNLLFEIGFATGLGLPV